MNWQELEQAELELEQAELELEVYTGFKIHALTQTD